VTKPDILAATNRYYSEKLRTHGATPKGVDWNDAESQVTRFEQLARVFRGQRSFSLNDIGCGYGALLDFLESRDFDVDYRGCDISNAMIEAARSRHAARSRAVFFAGSCPKQAADYSVCSGIFNVKGDSTESDWLDHIHATLDQMDQYSTRGFAFNCLSTYSDEHRRRADLYYADPCAFFDRCMTRYSRHSGLLHDYGLYEFTLLVKKDTPDR
jgi:SAM-dependent methyltransferase